MATIFRSPTPLIFRTHNSPRMRKLQCKTMACSSHTPESSSGPSFSKRDLMLLGLSSSMALVFPCFEIGAEEDVKMSPIVDDLNAYTYLCPVELPSKKFAFKWVVSRKPERYSSAAPLSPDARLRIVSERVDIVDNLIISVSVGPPNSTFLKSKDKGTWTAKDVADSVLSDKSALRVTSSQRMAESSILDTHSSDIDGQPYWYYEYMVRKSPTRSFQESNVFRQYIASTAERDGFLYTLNASTLSKQWDVMGPVLKKTVESFRLLPPTDNYVPPFKDPWRFWSSNMNKRIRLFKKAEISQSKAEDQREGLFHIVEINNEEIHFHVSSKKKTVTHLSLYLPNWLLIVVMVLLFLFGSSQLCIPCSSLMCNSFSSTIQLFARFLLLCSCYLLKTLLDINCSRCILLNLFRSSWINGMAIDMIARRLEMHNLFLVFMLFFHIIIT
ncbi:hypothetical protein V2J09_005246 [Rumex salicifolius]